MLEEGNDAPRVGFLFYLGGQNETRLGSVITRFTAGGSGFPSSRSGCQVGADYFMSRGLGRDGRWFSRLTAGPASSPAIQPK
jgi:hypothetical protein